RDWSSDVCSSDLSATVLATQLTDGRTWSTPVRQLLPDFAAPDDYVSAEATLGDMFAGTVGLPPDAGSAAARLGFDRQTIVSRVRGLPSAPFRTRARPGDLRPTIASEAVAHAAGTDWAGLAERALFAPLGMTATGVRAVASATDDARSTADGTPSGGPDTAAPQVHLDGRWHPVTDDRWTDAVAPA